MHHGNLGLVSYNCMSCRLNGRLSDISKAYARTSIICLQGLRLPADKNDAVITKAVGRHVWYIWGFGKGHSTNGHTGVAIGLNKRHFSNKQVIRIYTPPAYMQGRGGALRIRNAVLDVLVLSAYFPTEPKTESARKVTNNVGKWITSVLDTVPGRCVPLLAMDTNCFVLLVTERELVVTCRYFCMNLCIRDLMLVVLLSCSALLIARVARNLSSFLLPATERESVTCWHYCIDICLCL